MMICCSRNISYY